MCFNNFTMSANFCRGTAYVIISSLHVLSTFFSNDTIASLTCIYPARLAEHKSNGHMYIHPKSVFFSIHIIHVKISCYNLAGIFLALYAQTLKPCFPIVMKPRLRKRSIQYNLHLPLPNFDMKRRSRPQPVIDGESMDN